MPLPPCRSMPNNGRLKQVLPQLVQYPRTNASRRGPAACMGAALFPKAANCPHLFEMPAWSKVSSSRQEIALRSKLFKDKVFGTGHRLLPRYLGHQEGFVYLCSVAIELDGGIPCSDCPTPDTFFSDVASGSDHQCRAVYIRRERMVVATSVSTVDSGSDRQCRSGSIC